MWHEQMVPPYEDLKDKYIMNARAICRGVEGVGWYWAERDIKPGTWWVFCFATKELLEAWCRAGSHL